MSCIAVPEVAAKELMVQRILIHAAYLSAVDWFRENAGRAPNVDEQAIFVVAIVRCLTARTDTAADPHRRCYQPNPGRPSNPTLRLVED